MARPGLEFEHRIVRALKATGPERGRWLIACSGGLDSTVLCEALVRWRRLFGARLVLAHVHHGPGPGRDRARAEVKERARHHRLGFVTNRFAPPALSSEAEFREYRRRCLRRWGTELKCAHVLFAHHRDDLVETRVLRLLRGTGPAGLVAMRARNGAVLRPLLEIPRVDIEAYARARGLAWCEDPTNVDPRFQRNWVRHVWLPSLEARRPGATRALARSLALIAEMDPIPFGPGAAFALRRAEFARVPARGRARLLRGWLAGLGARDFGAAHVGEILKRLANAPAGSAFTVAGYCFHVAPDLVWASRV